MSEALFFLVFSFFGHWVVLLEKVFKARERMINFTRIGMTYGSVLVGEACSHRWQGFSFLWSVSRSYDDVSLCR